MAAAVRTDDPLVGRIATLVAAGTARTRSELAEALGVAPSTVSLRVAEMLDAGLLRETGEGASRGGRRPRTLELDVEGSHVLVADIGGGHVRLGALDLAGRLHAVREEPLDVGTGPEVALDQLSAALGRLVDAVGTTSRTRGVALALPGPVDVSARRVESPSRMPGWHSFPVGDRLEERWGVPVLVENDANAMALAEHLAHPSHPRHSVTVKAGTAIGSGMVVGGRLHRGATAAAGDITHARVAAAGGEPCSCGNSGCLETIASGAALVRRLRAEGVDVASTADVVALAWDGDPVVTTAVRSAGRRLGEVLCTVVGFFNPDAVLLGGHLSAVDPFVAAVRSQLYEGCHPLVTEHLTIDRATTGPDAGVLGVGRMLLDRLLAAGPPAPGALPTQSEKATQPVESDQPLPQEVS